ncbi:MAG: RNA pseudouridine synthase, partial [Phocaeicola sp.]|nr:RNA pseudouridine synthase [Phocaeicola sp.]
RYGSECDPLGRLAFHDFKLCFYHHVTGELMEFETPYPSAFKSLMLRK